MKIPIWNLHAWGWRVDNGGSANGGTAGGAVTPTATAAVADSRAAAATYAATHGIAGSAGAGNNDGGGDGCTAGDVITVAAAASGMPRGGDSTPLSRAGAHPILGSTMALCAPPHIAHSHFTVPLDRAANQPITVDTTHPRFEARAPFTSLYHHAADHDPGGVTGTLSTRGGTNVFYYSRKTAAPASLSTGECKK